MKGPLIYYPTPGGHGVPGRYCELLGIPEVRDLEPGMDFRRPEHRRETFLRFYEFHTKYGAQPGCVYFLLPYLRKRYGWTDEQALWFAFINGNTQNPVTSLLIFGRFPDFGWLAKGNLTSLKTWFEAEYARLAFDTDRRHHKTVFIEAVMKYLKLTDGNQTAYFSTFVRPGDPFGSFRRAWRIMLEKFHGFGRLSSFSYLEYIRILGRSQHPPLDIDCPQLFLEDLDGSKSHRNGLAKVLGRDDLDWHDSNPTGFAGNYSEGMMNWLRNSAQTLLLDAQIRMAQEPYSEDVSYFTLESTLCTYKSWHRPNRRYPGVYLDMLHDRIKKAEQAWPGWNFSVFWDARRECLPDYLRLEDTPNDPGVKPLKQNWYRETGQVILMDREWPCFENDYLKKKLCPT